MKFDISEMETEQIFSLVQALGWEVKEDVAGIHLFPPRKPIDFDREGSSREDFADAMQDYFDKTHEKEQGNKSLESFLREWAETVNCHECEFTLGLTPTEEDCRKCLEGVDGHKEERIEATVKALTAKGELEGE